MAIQISPKEAQRKLFPKSLDPEQETYVLIKPYGHSENVIREGLLSGRSETFWTDRATGEEKVKYESNVNKAMLYQTEIVLTFGGTNMMVDGKPLFPDSLIDKQADFEVAFINANLDPAIVTAWARMVREVNPDWEFPFRIPEEQKPKNRKSD